MKIPEGMTEEEVLETIETVAVRLAGRFKFGYHTIEDMRQQARMYAWQGLDTYDNMRPLENFLWTHVRNRLFNFKRDKFQRPDKPCLNCPLNAYDPECKESDSGCTAFNNLPDCEHYSGWLDRNVAKKNIMLPIGLGNVRDENEKNLRSKNRDAENIDLREIFELIQAEIPMSLRADWLRMRYDIRIPKQRRIKVREAIEHILAEHNIDVEKTW